MSIKLRHQISEKIVDVLKCNFALKSKFASSLELNISSSEFEFHLHLNQINKIANDSNPENLKKLKDETVKSADISNERNNAKVVFKLHKKRVVDDLFRDPLNVAPPGAPSNILVEFSSPNIAKPFHVGHLRSTIIGNFLSNLFKQTQNNVTRINYLGDWGTQFGFLKVGVDLQKLTDEDIKKSPIETLYRAYVLANQMARDDLTIAEQARAVFTQMENDSFPDLDRWQLFRTFTVNELKSVYERLNVNFDAYEWESMYNKNQIQEVINLMTNKNVLFADAYGKKVVQVGDRRVPIVKSDGSTLYLTRDVAAVLDRKQRYDFDQILYVVDNGQNDHFTALKSIIHQLGLGLSENMTHVKFGRIRGMSTRKGTAIFLKEILDEAKEVMFRKQMESKTTKVDLSKTEESVADVLGISAVIINDLKQRRQRDYDFSWDRALQVTGDTGIKLQYTHCRLCSLELTCREIEEAEECYCELISEQEAVNLIFELAKYPEIIGKTQESLESCILVNYLFALCNATSKALKVLNVKNAASPQLSSQRLLLFKTTRKILHHGMCILGLKPLNEM